MSKFEKGRAKTGGRKPSAVQKLKSFRKELAEKRYSVVGAMIDLLNKTRDEQLKFEILKLMLEYSQLKPTTDLDEEGAGVEQISERQLLAIASGDTTSQQGYGPDETSCDQDADDEGQLGCADAFDTTQDVGTVEGE